MSALHAIAPAVVKAMMFCLIEGTLLGLFVYLVLRIAPRKNSGTRFAIWFATLVAVILAPVVTLPSLKALSAARSASPHGILTLPASLAVWAFLGWTAVAAVGLLRVAVGFWQVLRLRKNCVAINLADLSPEVREIVEQSQKSRPVLIATSPKLDVPTAIGFRSPAILLPAWLVAEASPTELKHVLLHELAHLRRRDDWTNLVQKLVKALLFFHPLVWWIESRLSLERELACDDAVLAHTECPRVYAQCLARIAEKSFLRRQIALAQAAVSRMHHLSCRVMQILDSQRPRTTRLWKPAIPLVAVLALTCAISLRQAPALVSFTEGQTTPVTTSSRSVAPVIPANAGIAHHYPPANPQDMGAQLISARFKLNNRGPSVSQRLISRRAVKHVLQSNPVEHTGKAPPATAVLASYSGYVVAHEELVITMASQGVPGQWHVQVWQLRVLVPAHQTEKPTPRKT
ncbi:MAG TPA: M56 family metallopeptidase [Candidatus Angelobacter sp.]|jgi:beta-lactamase regulating signal transducer with metallopeptidase domain|nr:M56 family metallopeptidase [Candidatus Angelobacter sp.]